MTAFVPFSFSTVPHIVTELGASARLGHVIRERFPLNRHVLIVTDQGVVKAGLLDAVLSGLHACTIEASVYDQVVADPPDAVILDAVKPGVQG